MEELYNSLKDIKLLSAEDEYTLGKRIQGWLSLQEILQKEEREPTPTERETLKTGKEAYDLLVTANIRLAICCAKKFSYKEQPSMTIDDLIQEANLGLMRAAKAYDPERKTRFSTYAVFWIDQFIHRALEDKADTIRKPASIHSKIRKINKTREEIMREERQIGPVSHRKLSSRTGMSEDEIKFIQETSQQQVVSMDSRPEGYYDDDYSSYYDTIPSEYDLVSDFDQDEQQEMIEKLASSIKDPLKQKIIRLRLGLNDESVEVPAKRIAFLLRIEESFVNRTVEDTLNLWRQPFYYNQLAGKNSRDDTT